MFVGLDHKTFHEANFEAKTFKVVMNNFISCEAEIRSDGFASYISMMKEYPKLEMVLSCKGRSMLHLHNQMATSAGMEKRLSSISEPRIS